MVISKTLISVAVGIGLGTVAYGLRVLWEKRKLIALRLSSKKMGKETAALQAFILAINSGQGIKVMIAPEYVVCDRRTWDEVTHASLRMARDLAERERRLEVVEGKLTEIYGGRSR